jgi:hypothetical protein
MKKLIIVLFPFISLAQQSFYKLDSVEYYFIQELSAYRKQTYTNIPTLLFSDIMSKAAQHHTMYLVHMQSADNSIQVLTHEEPRFISGITYQGTDILINSIAERSAYYDVDNVFAGFGEVIQSLGVYTTSNSTDSRKIAKMILDRFLASPAHKQILDAYGYTHIGISIIAQQSIGDSIRIFICIRPCALSNTKYLHSNTFFPYYYGNKLTDIQ